MMPSPPNLISPFTMLEGRKDLDTCQYGYKLAGSSYGLDTAYGEFDIDEKRMALRFPYADGSRRDGVGDLLEVGGIRTDRHVKNPIVLFDHGKQVHLPIGKAEDPNTGAYTVEIDPVGRKAWLTCFFYQGKGLPGAKPHDEYDHALFCEQLFDLAAKRYIRAGSIGYQVVKALKLPADYEQGTPPGLHLLVTLMLEGSLVVLPANGDTVRKALALPQVCGKALSPVLVKSLSPYAEPVKAMMTLEKGFMNDPIRRRPRDTRSNQGDVEYPSDQMFDKGGNPVDVKGIPRTEDDDSHDDWAANAERVVNNAENASPQDIIRAISFFQKWEIAYRGLGKHDMADSMRGELDYLKGVLRKKQKGLQTSSFSQEQLAKSIPAGVNAKFVINLMVSSGRVSNWIEEQVCRALGLTEHDLTQFGRALGRANDAQVEKAYSIIANSEFAERYPAMFPKNKSQTSSFSQEKSAPVTREWALQQIAAGRPLSPSVLNLYPDLRAIMAKDPRYADYKVTDVTPLGYGPQKALPDYTEINRLQNSLKEAETILRYAEAHPKEYTPAKTEMVKRSIESTKQKLERLKDGFPPEAFDSWGKSTSFSQENGKMESGTANKGYSQAYMRGHNDGVEGLKPITSNPYTHEPEKSEWSQGYKKGSGNKGIKSIQDTLQRARDGEASESDLIELRGYRGNPRTDERLRASIVQAMRDGGYKGDDGSAFFNAMSRKKDIKSIRAKYKRKTLGGQEVKAMDLESRILEEVERETFVIQAHKGVAKAKAVYNNYDAEAKEKESYAATAPEHLKRNAQSDAKKARKIAESYKADIGKAEQILQETIQRKIPFVRIRLKQELGTKSLSSIRRKYMKKAFRYIPQGTRVKITGGEHAGRTCIVEGQIPKRYEKGDDIFRVVIDEPSWPIGVRKTTIDGRYLEKGLGGLSPEASVAANSIKKKTGKEVWQMMASEFNNANDPTNSRWFVGYDDRAIYDEILRTACIRVPDQVPDAVLNQFRGQTPFQSIIEDREWKKEERAKRTKSLNVRYRSKVIKGFAEVQVKFALPDRDRTKQAAMFAEMEASGYGRPQGVRWSEDGKDLASTAEMVSYKFCLEPGKSLPAELEKLSTIAAKHGARLVGNTKS